MIFKTRLTLTDQNLIKTQKRLYSGTDAFASDIEFYRTNSKESLFDAALADRNYAGEYSCKTKAYTNCDSQSKKHLITSCHFRFICLSIVRFSCCDYIIPRICALFNGQFNHVLLVKQQMCSVLSHKRHSRKKLLLFDPKKKAPVLCVYERLLK